MCFWYGGVRYSRCAYGRSARCTEVEPVFDAAR